ncbi:double-strand break repair helicase AddA [Rhodosalinus sp. K401]|uniref:double-strand break repair helicase AddA n=1 Tax=Rhodosalinus sp. K401 TaxID=3239195 RepID=UPI003523E877
MSRRDAASQRQVEAAAPDFSTWLAANAGSGKTRVLTDRVARLLLGGTAPESILCLTYTKAAASEMQNRLFERLGEWAMLEDAALRDELAKLGEEGRLNRARLRRARTLFARAIEAPGGLKIQTIHAFCAGLLRRFPLEAGVTPGFTEMEDRAGALLRAEIVERMAEGPDASAVETLAGQVDDGALEGLTTEIVKHREGFVRALGWDDALALFGLPPGTDAASIEARVFLGGERALLDALIPALLESGGNDEKAGQRLAAIDSLGLASLPALEDAFLYGAGARAPFAAKIGSFPTKRVQNGAFAPHMPALEAFMQRVEAAREPRLALEAARRTHALHAFARPFLETLEAEKQRRGWLDFDDLILHARRLLSDEAVADWVLFRLDGGLDHILVDEAQDTSPEQWAVIELLAREFTAGEGARPDAGRSLFVVGDKKQSIYSFQGADPGAFDRMQAEFARRLRGSDRPLQSLTLDHSFRSSPAILRAVDATFEGRVEAGFSGGEPHIAFKKDMPGRVDLWPVVPRAEKPEEEPWYAPVDRTGEAHHAVRLARRIADAIHDMIESRAPVARAAKGAPGWRLGPVRPGDIMVLVQRRSELFHEIIGACKARGLPVAGADRLKLGAELAVRDLGAVLQVLDLPEDDLSLAAALRSPLFGLSEQELFDLAHRRHERHLWQALTRRRTEFPEAYAILDDLMAEAEFLRPYDLIERILIRHDGRRRLIGRLGPEAQDGIDALLGQALAYERGEVPSLTGFLQWMQADDQEIKRQMDAAGDRIRVMTVHGAKGLEAPVVILPDSGKRDIRLRDRLVADGGDVLWAMPADAAPDRLRAAREAAIAAQEAERDRLLYVAMTRAESWLIVAAGGELGKDGRAWHDQVRTGLERLGAEVRDFGFEDAEAPGLRLRHGAWDAPESAKLPAPTTPPALPGWATRTAPVASPPPETLSPSDLGGAKALPGEAGLDETAAKVRGTRLHLLLEHLPAAPRADWQILAERLLARPPEPAPASEVAALLAEARAVLDAPALAPLFAPGALAEVPVSAALAELGGRRVHGTIDRLLIAPGRMTAVDFKTNAVVPARPEEVPEGLLRQMGAYAAALAQVFPDHAQDIAIVWTRTATLMPLPRDLVIGALARAGAP